MGQNSNAPLYICECCGRNMVEPLFLVHDLISVICEDCHVCIICKQKQVDGALEQFGEFVCVDCWATGEAAKDCMTAITFVPAKVPYRVEYPLDKVEKILAVYNKERRVSEDG